MVTVEIGFVSMGDTVLFFYTGVLFVFKVNAQTEFRFGYSGDGPYVIGGHSFRSFTQILQFDGCLKWVENVVTMNRGYSFCT